MIAFLAYELIWRSSNSVRQVETYVTLLPGRQVYAVKNQSMNSRISDYESIEYHLTLILWYFDIFIIHDLIHFTSLMKSSSFIQIKNSTKVRKQIIFKIYNLLKKFILQINVKKNQNLFSQTSEWKEKKKNERFKNFVVNFNSRFCFLKMKLWENEKPNCSTKLFHILSYKNCYVLDTYNTARKRKEKKPLRYCTCARIQHVQYTAVQYAQFFFIR